MTTNIVKLYPPPAGERPLPGTYLAHKIRERALQQETPYLYTNYIVSLDGRIAVQDAHTEEMHVPPTMGNERDWRLFQELAFQADTIICNTRYVQAVADGQIEQVMGMEKERFSDLQQWRLEQGLSTFPDTAIVSKRLNVEIAPQLVANGRRVAVFTTADSDPKKRAAIAEQGGEVFIVGETGVDGRQMIDQMQALGYRAVYNVSGAKILHILLAAGGLDRFYLTHAHRLLGGSPYVPLLEGELLEPAVDLQLNEIYLDPHGLDGCGQLFVSYDRKRD